MKRTTTTCGGKTFVQALVDLGAVATLDTTKLSPTILESVASHVRLLQRNGFSLDRETLVGRSTEVLNQLRDRNGKLLNEPYKRQIAITIKRMYPDTHIDLRDFKKMQIKATRSSSDSFVLNVRKIIDRAVQIVRRASETKKIENVGTYDTCLAVLLSCSTSLRINEIMNLEIKHIDMIRDNEPVDIRSKASTSFRTVAPNELLLGVFDIVLAQRPKLELTINAKILERWFKQQQRRLDERYIIVTSVDFMRKELHETAASLLIPKYCIRWDSTCFEASSREFWGKAKDTLSFNP